MRKIVFPYQLRQYRGGAYQAIPLCRVIVHGRIRSVVVDAAVDSGATHPFFPLSAAQDAGVDLSAGRSFHVTWGGSENSGILVPTYINIGDQRLRAEIVYVDDLRLGHALLGRHTVFPKFREVCFLESTPDKRAELRY